MLSSDHDRGCVSALLSPSLSYVTPRNPSLCHCPNCLDHLLLSHFRERTVKLETSITINYQNVHKLSIQKIKKDKILSDSLEQLARFFMFSSKI